jgi:hypothetical protein
MYSSYSEHIQYITYNVLYCIACFFVWVKSVRFLLRLSLFSDGMFNASRIMPHVVNEVKHSTQILAILFFVGDGDSRLKISPII